MSPPSWHHHTCKSPAMPAKRMEVDVPDSLSFFTYLVLFQQPVNSASLFDQNLHLLSAQPCSDPVLLHLCAAHAQPEPLPSHKGRDVTLHAESWLLHSPAPLFHQTLQHSLGLGETKLNPTAQAPAAHQGCLCTQTGHSPALPHTSCSGVRHGHTTPPPLDQTGIGKHREDLCCLSNHSEHAHGHGRCAKQQHSPEPVLCMGWVRTRLKTTCLTQGLKSAQLNSHPHSKEQKPREANSAPSKEPASLHPWDFLLGASSWDHEDSFIRGVLFLPGSAS